MNVLSEEQIAHWKHHGWLLIDDCLSPDEVREFPRWLEEIANPSKQGEQRLHYYEQTSNGPVICRTERYLDDHPRLARLLTQGVLPAIASDLIGEPALLFKEKINYKHAGGAGFAPHQDATAYRDVESPFTCLVAVDPMTREGGCLEFGPYQHGLLPEDGDGCIDREVAAGLDWQPVEVAAGGVLFFNAFVPHRSARNDSARARRTLYVTYNPAREGDLRVQYYERRACEIEATTDAPNARISNIGHFQGEPVDAKARVR
ncbi:MAG: ectoine hydroxylase-related dioxygenase (phytanoyl-CoA dioxygenase family) [Gammaproteobacteria bacterium]|jgi:ectoine hydroxylase-related dioxygenase (phytanoyl-CoA dioxygenase family)